MRPTHQILLLAVAAVATGCAGMNAKPQTSIAVLQPRSGSTVSGTVRLVEKAGQVHAHVDLAGLPPDSVHGFHVHDKGDCSAPDAASAGGHFNPGSTAHGQAGPGVHHAGDVPSLKADGAGRVRAEFDIAGVTLGEGPTSILGRSLVVHRDADDYTTQPSGNSGPRVACGVIGAQ